MPSWRTEVFEAIQNEVRKVLERSGAFRDVIRASNRQESEIARLRDAFAAKSNRGERKLKLYHGTSLEAALRIASRISWSASRSEAGGRPLTCWKSSRASSSTS